jgi:cytochrome c
MRLRCRGDMSAKQILLVAAVFLGIAGATWDAPAKPIIGWILDGAQEKQAARANVAHGKKVYDARCEICHFSTSTQKKIGPGLKGLMARGKYAGGKKVDEESLRTWIENGGKDMPGYKGVLKEEEVRDLIAYIKTL